jgi:hypothetical protein
MISLPSKEHLYNFMALYYLKGLFLTKLGPD